MPLHRSEQTGRASRGFTLIELLVVMVIIVIGFFAARPNIGGLLRGSQERTAIRQLIGVFQVARTEALASGRLVRVSYLPEDSAFAAEVQSSPETDLAAFEPLKVLGREFVRVPGHWEVSELEIRGRPSPTLSEPIYFYPDGRTDGVAIVFTDEEGKTTVLRLSSATGKPDLHV